MVIGWLAAVDRARAREPHLVIAPRVLRYIRLGRRDALGEGVSRFPSRGAAGPTLSPSAPCDPSTSRGALPTRPANNDAPVLRLAGRTDASQSTIGG